MGKWLGFTGLGLALLAVAPSYAAFTPAFLVSLLALWLAAAAAAAQSFVLSLLTFVVSTLTVLFVSPITGIGSVTDHASVLWVVVPSYLIYLAGITVGLRKKWSAQR